METPAPRLHLLCRSAPAHSDNDGSRQDGVRQPTETRQRNGAVCRDLLRLHLFPDDDAAPGNCSFPMASIEQTPKLLVVHGLGTEDRIDLIKENCGTSILVR